MGVGVDVDAVVVVVGFGPFGRTKSFPGLGLISEQKRIPAAHGPISPASQQISSSPLASTQAT